MCYSVQKMREFLGQIQWSKHKRSKWDSVFCVGLKELAALLLITQIGDIFHIDFIFLYDRKKINFADV